MAYQQTQGTAPRFGSTGRCAGRSAGDWRKYNALQVHISIHNHTQNTTSHVLYVIVNIYIHTIVIDAPTGMFHIEFNTEHF